MMTSTAITATAAAVSNHRTSAGSSLTLRAPTRPDCGALPGISSLRLGMMAPAPAFKRVNYDEHCKGERQKDDRDRSRLAIGKFLQTRDDQDRSDLRPMRKVTGYEHNGSVLTKATRETKSKTRE